jgi:hypothetical protein
MLNKDVLAHDPSEYRLADGGVAKVLFPPPDAEQKAILREQLQTFVCEGAYADGQRRMLEAFKGAAGRHGMFLPPGSRGSAARAKACSPRCWARFGRTWNSTMAPPPKGSSKTYRPRSGRRCANCVLMPLGLADCWSAAQHWVAAFTTR